MPMDYQISQFKNIQNFSEESSLKNWRQMFYVLRNMPSGGTLFTLVFTGEVYAVSPVTPAAQTRISRKRCIVILHVQNIACIEFSFTKTSMFTFMTVTRLLSWNHSTAWNPYTAASVKIENIMMTRNAYERSHLQCSGKTKKAAIWTKATWCTVSNILHINILRRYKDVSGAGNDCLSEHSRSCVHTPGKLNSTYIYLRDSKSNLKPR